MPTRVVTTLPTSPRKLPALGFFLLPYLSHLLGRLQDLRVIGPVNLLGARKYGASEADAFETALSHLAIVPDTQWRDSDLAWNSILPVVVTEGLNQGWIRRDVVSVFVCPCGKTEFLNKPSNLVSGNFNRKVYEINDGVPSCLLCKATAVARHQDALLLVLPRHIPTVSLVPRYAAETWADLIANLSGREIPVSRMRETGLSVTVAGTRFNVDVDVASMLHPYLLREQGMEIETLVSGNRTLKHTFMATVVSNLLGVPYPKTIVSAPYLTVDFGNREPLNARNIIEQYGAPVARSLLLSGLGSTRKEVIVPSRTIHLVQHSIRVQPESLKVISPQNVSARDLWRDFSGQMFQNALSCLRRGHPEELPTLSKQVLSIALFP